MAVSASCYDHRVRRDDLIAYARRDWAALEDSKAEFWVARKSAMSAAEVLAVGDELRRYAQGLAKNWPDAADRAEDESAHIRVAEALRAVGRQRSG